MKAQENAPQGLSRLRGVRWGCAFVKEGALSGKPAAPALHGGQPFLVQMPWAASTAATVAAAVATTRGGETADFQ